MDSIIRVQAQADISLYQMVVFYALNLQFAHRRCDLNCPSLLTVLRLTLSDKMRVSERYRGPTVVYLEGLFIALLVLAFPHGYMEGQEP